jgi:hypothetical protein
MAKARKRSRQFASVQPTSCLQRPSVRVSERHRSRANVECSHCSLVILGTFGHLLGEVIRTLGRG